MRASVISDSASVGGGMENAAVSQPGVGALLGVFQWVWLLV